MKKILVYAAALLSMAFAASCQKEVSSAVADGELVTVTFNIATEAPLQSKAVVGHEPDWDKTLTMGVYRNASLLDADVYEITDQFGTDNNATVTVTLVKGQEYDFVFWADATGNDYYTVDLMGKNVTVSYDNANANDKLRDAWYAVLEGYKVTDQTINQKVELKRALAQINVGTLDYADAVTAGVTVTKSEMTVTNAASTLEFFSGKTLNPVSVTFAADVIPMYSLDQNANTLTVHYGTQNEAEYEYLALNYILVADDSATGAEQDIVTVGINFYEDGNNNPVNDPIELTNVPVRRNYRTNIISENVLTDVATFSIVIDPIFAGEYIYPDQNGTVTPTPTPVDNNLYLNPGPWNVDGAWFAAYFFGNAGDTSVKMIKDGNYYKCEKVAGDYANVIFVRMNPSYTTFTWDGKWNQTGDLVIPTDGKNLYTVTGWGTADGTWSVK